MNYAWSSVISKVYEKRGADPEMAARIERALQTGMLSAADIQAALAKDKAR